MVVVKRKVSKIGGHLNAIFEALKEILKPNTITVHYPKEIRNYSNIRGYLEIVINDKICIGCAKCARICPANAILMKKIEGKYYPTIDFGKCIFCHFCVDVCPAGILNNTMIHDLSFESPNIVIGPREVIRRREIKRVKYKFKEDLKVERC